MKMQEWVTSVKCHTPSRCTVCCTLLRTRKPSVLSSHLHLKISPIHRSSPFQGEELELLKPSAPHPGSFETSTFSSPYSQRPLHSGVLPQQTHSGLYDSEKFLPLTSNSPESIVIILFTKANKRVDSGAIIVLLSLFNHCSLSCLGKRSRA